jgi:hypothetical protein
MRETPMMEGRDDGILVWCLSALLHRIKQEKEPYSPTVWCMLAVDKIVILLATENIV